MQPGPRGGHGLSITRGCVFPLSRRRFALLALAMALLCVAAAPVRAQIPADYHPGQLYLGTHPGEASFNFKPAETCCRPGPVDNVTVTTQDRTPPLLRTLSQAASDNAALRRLLAVYEHKSSLPESLVQAGFSNGGNRARLRRVMDRLLHGALTLLSRPHASSLLVC